MSKGNTAKDLALERLKLLSPRAVAKIGVMLDDDDIPAMVHAKLVSEVLKYSFAKEENVKDEGITINVYHPDRGEPI